ISDHLITLLTNFIKSAEQKLDAISILSQSELDRLANKYNRVDYPQDLLLPQLIANQHTPDKIALVTGALSLTYAELNKRINQLAHYLHGKLQERSQNIKNNKLIGILLDRDSDLIISLLAVLKIGAAYIPLDPNFPTERINYIINDAAITYLITKENVGLSDFDTNLSIINLDREQENIQRQSTANLNLDIQPQDLAYVIYTSGSTGKPKGVAVQHNSLLNFLYSMKEQPGIEENDRMLAVTTISFDIAALEIYLPLITGAKVILADKETTVDADLLSQKIAAENVTIMQATPATWRMLLDNHWQGKSNLKILCGGEALPQKLAAGLANKCREIWNLYGPTETTIWSSVYQFKTEGDRQLNTVPIGQPIANTQFYILDSQLNIVPPGRSGELYIGGAGISRGYLNRPDLTAEKFIPNPFLCEALNDSLLYKTGDRVRQLPNGNLEYLGRLDNQVKIRGYRLELGEIEAVLNQYPQIQTSVVVLNNERLVAYIVSEISAPSAFQEIRYFLAQKLPGYMIPRDIIPLESFPLTPNGKIDRTSLSNLDIESQEQQPIAATATTPTEEILRGIWTEILERANINTDDNFFELGGHSLLATRVVSQIRQVFSIELPLRNLFEYPTVRDLALIIDRQQKNSPEKPVEITIVAREGELPLSFAQQRQWFLHQLEPDNPWYNISTAVKIRGSLDLARLQQCFDILVERQEILRTSFITVEGQPKLIIHDVAKIELPVVNLSASSTKEQRQQIKQLQIADAQQPFALDSCPLMRVKLMSLGDNEQILLLSLHHIIGDGWSMGVLVDEIVGLYESGGAEEQREQREREIQYVDYAAWQRKYLQGKVLERQVEYWQDKLADAPPISSIATDYPRKSQSSFESAAYNFQLNDSLTQSLKQISRSNSVTLFMTLYAAVALLLHRYTDNDDLVVGTPIANRDRAEIAGLIGFFANTLALRIDLAHNPSFTELLARARETALEAYSHQDLPFEQLIDRLQLERSLSHTPLFQVMLVLEPQNKNAVEVPGLAWKPLERVTTQAKFELTFLIKETDKGLQGAIEYNQALFTADTIHRLAGHFRTLLMAIAENPEAKISNISILGKSELKQLTSKFNQSNHVAVDNCIHELFASQANLTPNAVAIVDGATEITYQELNRRANTWVHYLQSLGVRSETKVGVMGDRQIDTIVALIAILKAGGCYVPLDPNYPQQRLNWMLEDTQLNILLTETKYRHKLGTQNLTIIDLNSRPESITYSNPPITHQDNLAYIIYTSGSTGVPKGVAIPHRGVVRLVKEPNYVELNTDTVSLQAAPISFDASTFEIWGALLNGGRIVILSNPVPSLAELGETIVQHKINTLWLTAGLFHLMVDEQLNSFRNVRQVLAGGDVLSSSHIQTFLEAYPQSSLINGYGPTESTTFACCYRLDKDTETNRDRSIIGYPITNTQLYILDQYLNPVPVGVAGELYIAGLGLARGYLNRPELTAEKFIPNPFIETKHALSPLYKTGDRVRYQPSGKIEYLGRIDNQVKIRGFRVELGEVETALKAIEDIKDSVVLFKDNALGNKQLLAYIIPYSLDDNQENKWHKLLKTKLPDYLIPSALITCAAFPLTANGKLDRQQLLARDIILQDPLEIERQPQTEIELKLRQIWSEVLNLETVGIDSNFFSLGGDSILAIQIIAKANQAGIELTPKQLFEYQTIAELAAVAQIKISHTAEQGLVSGSIPLTPIQQWFFELGLANLNHFNQSVLLEIQQNLNLDILSQAIQYLLVHHDALRINFIQTNNAWSQYNSDVIPTLKIQQIDLSDLSAAAQTTAIVRESDLLQAIWINEPCSIFKLAC
ncbi:MAG: amino acid adenylation domain-containing protein, partial [Cyanobacteria bacterium J06623_7]